MPDRFLTTIITDMAIKRANIDSMPTDSAREILENEFSAKFRELENSVSADLRYKIGEMISEEVARHNRSCRE